ncbi:MAG: TetR/AcrR family transcriptional regulator [Gemmataceae bacterium]
MTRPAQQRIISAARQHFLAHGFRGVTMDDLAAELGMSKKTLYAHFPSKTALVELVLNDKLSEIEAGFDEILGRGGEFHDTLHDLLATIQRHTAELQPPFVRDMRREAPQVFQTVEKRRGALIEKSFGALFTEGRRTGMVRKDIPVRLMVEVLLAATHAIMNPAQMARLRLTPKIGFTAIIQIVLEGVLTRKGGPKS